jgi:hypothetical protein
MINTELELSDITLGEYIGWYASTNDIMKYQAITGLSIEDARNTPLEQINAEFDLFEKAMAGHGAVFKNRFTLSGVDYGMIPDFKRKLTGGAFADLMHFSNPENIKQDIAKVMCILYRPVTGVSGDSYDIEVYDSAKHLQNEEHMKKLTLDVVNGVLLFFSIIRSDLKSSSQTYLDSQMNQVMETISHLKKQVPTA